MSFCLFPLHGAQGYSHREWLHIRLKTSVFAKLLWNSWRQAPLAFKARWFEGCTAGGTLEVGSKPFTPFREAGSSLPECEVLWDAGFMVRIYLGLSYLQYRYFLSCLTYRSHPFSFWLFLRGNWSCAAICILCVCGRKELQGPMSLSWWCLHSFL